MFANCICHWTGEGYWQGRERKGSVWNGHFDSISTFEDLSKQVCIVFVVEGGVSAEQDVGDHPDAPDVDRLPVRLLGQHLRGDVAGGPAGGGHHAALLHLGEAEVADHDLAVRVRAATSLIRLDCGRWWVAGSLSRSEDFYLLCNSCTESL